MTKEEKQAYLNELLDAWNAGHFRDMLFLLASNYRDKGDLGSFLEYHVEEYERWYDEDEQAGGVNHG